MVNILLLSALVVSSPLCANDVEQPTQENETLAYNIVYDLSNVSIEEKVETIKSGELATIEVKANDGYALPNEIVVSGASYLWDNEQGALILKDATENVSVKIVGVVAETKPTETETDGEVDENTIATWFSNFASQYLNQQTISAIINYAVDSGVLGALVIIYNKYRKYKAMSSTEIANDVVDTCKKEISKALKDMSKEDLEKNAKRLEDIETALNTLTKAMVLAQDKTAEGKVALLNVLTEKTKDEETKAKAKELKEDVETEEKKKEEVLNKLDEIKTDDYDGTSI